MVTRRAMMMMMMSRLVVDEVEEEGVGFVSAEGRERDRRKLEHESEGASVRHAGAMLDIYDSERGMVVE